VAIDAEVGSRLIGGGGEEELEGGSGAEVGDECPAYWKPWGG
jgi:hypothetical protein